MARRMFSPQIVGSDAFLDMPTSSRELYFQLGMHADDDGFVNPKRVMRLVGAQEDDLKVLVAKKFVLPFDNGVIVIKHWRINNLVRKDWYRPSPYIEQKMALFLKENGAYTLDSSQGEPLVNESLTESLTNRSRRIGKDKINIPELASAHSGSPLEEEISVKTTTHVISHNHKKKMEDEPKMSFFGFPLPEGWREENYGYESEDAPMPKIVIYDDKGIQIPKREITRRIEAYRRSQRPSAQPDKDERVPRIFQKFRELCQKELGQTPVKDAKAMSIVKFALNSGGLSETQIYDLFDEWFAKGRPDDETIQITRALSSNNINGYKARTRI